MKMTLCTCEITAMLNCFKLMIPKFFRQLMVAGLVAALTSMAAAQNPSEPTNAAKTAAKKAAAEAVIEAKYQAWVKHNVAINDLFSVISPRLAELQNPNDCHFNAAGNRFLGEAVANFIEAWLERPADLSANGNELDSSARKLSETGIPS